MQPVDRPLRVGIVGLGRIYDLNVRGYRGNPDTEVVALCDADEEALARRGDEWPGAGRFADYDAFLGADLDLVELLTPSHLHADQAAAALDAGCHVSVQKPMAPTLDQAGRMIEAAEGARRILRVFENYVFYEPYVRAKQIVESGAIGDPLMLHLKMVAGLRGGWEVPGETLAWRFAMARDGRGPMIWDDGHHKFSVMHWLFGPVEEITADIGEVRIGDGADAIVVDTPATLMWRHASGVRGLWDATLAPEMELRSDYYPVDERLEITGSRGWVRVTRCTGRPLDEPALLVYVDGELTEHHDLDDDWGSSFAAATHHLIGVLRSGDGEPVWTGEQGREVLRLSLAALESSKQRRPVAVASLG